MVMMERRKDGMQKFEKSKNKGERGAIKGKKCQVNGTSMEKPSLSTISKETGRVKKKSKVRTNEQKITVHNDGQKEDGDSLSSNWKEFIKEVEQNRKQTGLAEKESKAGQKRKILRRYSQNTNKERNRNNKESNTEEKSILNESDIWFDDVDIEDIEHAIGKKLKCNGNSSEKPKSGQDVNSNANLQLHDHKASITKQLGIDCEMVGVGIDGKDSMLARVSIVNSFGDTVYDTFVAPMQDVVDYRTEFSGVRPQNLINAPQFTDVQRDVANITNGKILVGHAIQNDLKALLLSHAKKNIRDTSTYKPFKKLLKTQFPSLKKLTKEILNIDIQSGEHSSVEDAKCAIKIYQLHKRKWENSLKHKGYKDVIKDSSKIFMGRNSEYQKKRYNRIRRIQRQRKKGKNLSFKS